MPILLDVDRGQRTEELGDAFVLLVGEALHHIKGGAANGGVARLVDDVAVIGEEDSGPVKLGGRFDAGVRGGGAGPEEAVAIAPIGEGGAGPVGRAGGTELGETFFQPAGETLLVIDELGGVVDQLGTETVTAIPKRGVGLIVDRGPVLDIVPHAAGIGVAADLVAILAEEDRFPARS